MSSSILADTATREIVSKEWMKTAGAVVVGAMRVPWVGAPIVGATIGEWLAKAVQDKKNK